MVEKPTPQPVTEQAALNNFKEVPTVTRLDLKKAEERHDTGRNVVPKKSVAKRDDSKASGSGNSRCSSGSIRPRSRSKAPRSSTSQKTSRENYKKPGPREFAATAHIPGSRYAAPRLQHHS